MPLTMKDEDNREWMAIGLNPETGEILWIPGDTEVVAFSLAEETPNDCIHEDNIEHCMYGCGDDDPSDDQIPPPDGITGASPTTHEEDLNA